MKYEPHPIIATRRRIASVLARQNSTDSRPGITYTVDCIYGCLDEKRRPIHIGVSPGTKKARCRVCNGPFEVRW